MSKRGRRRNSRRRRSSSSSKQTVTSIPYISCRQDKNNSVDYTHNILEKREKEYLGKEKVLSGSEDDEKCDNAPPREKRLKQDCHISSSHNRSTYTTTTEHIERAVKIVTSVSVDNMKEMLSKITFQQSHEPISENPLHSAPPVTNVININCMGPHLKLEMKEFTQHNSYGINTTVVVINEKQDCTENFGKIKNEQKWSPNNEQRLQHVATGRSQSTSNYTRYVSEDTTENAFKCVTSNIQCTDHDEQISKYPPALINIKPQRKKRLFCKSFSSDHFWDIPPPQEFADRKYCTLEGLVSDLDSCKISSCSTGETQQRQFDRVPNKEFGRTFYEQVKGNDEFLESDNYNSMSIRPWLSSNRSSLTKDFIKCQKTKSCVAAAEHSECLFPQRRRQTFPSMDRSLTQDFVSYSDSFSSGTISPMPQTKTLGIASMHSFVPFCMPCSDDHPENTFAVNEQLGEQSKYDDPDDCVHTADQSEVADSGFEQEMGELERHSPDRQRALAIQGIPPSCSGSEEHVLQSHQKLSGQNGEGENENSVVKATNGLFKQSFLKDSKLGLGSCKQSLNMSTLQHIDGPSPSTFDDIKPKAFTENANLSLRDKKTRESLLNKGSCCAQSFASFPANGFLNTATNIQEHPNTSEIPDKNSITRSSLEAKEHLKLLSLRDADNGTPDSWARRRKLFKDSKQWSSAGGSSFTSDITEESEEVHSMDLTIQDNENKGFYAETFHSTAWLYQGEKDVPGSISSSARTRTVSIRERTVKIDKGIGDYPWGFRIQFSNPIVVTEVDTNGAAEEAGLMVGDYVLAVNGTDVTSISHSEAANLARQGPEELTLTIGSDIGRGPNTPRPACRGYLHKRTQSGLIRGWRKRWFVLTHDCLLYYYRHKRDEGKSQALAALKMEGAEVGPDLSLGKPFVLKCHPLSANRVYYLCATSNQEMKRWLEAMERAIHPIMQYHVWVDVTRHNSGLPPLAVKNPECLGLLHKMDKSKDTWVQHYSILKDGCLYLYSGIRATHAHGGIYLQGYMVREQHFGSKKSIIELKPPSDEFKTFYFCADNPNDNKRWIIAFKTSINKWLPLHQALQNDMSQPPEATRM
ncbi:uncharacterized protein pdzph1 isoform X2 [Festucalex cinctus]